MPDPSPLLLGLDAGGSGTKWHLRQGANTVAQGRTAPLTTALLLTAQGRLPLQELPKIIPAVPQAIYLGIPGLEVGSARAAEVRREVAAAFGLPDWSVQVESDLALAFRTHLRPGQGALVYAGTGSIAYGVAEDGRVFRSGGRGYRIGDDGGGSSLGRAALRWATGFLDVGEVPSGPLASEIAGITGGLDWETLRHFVYDTPGAAALAKLAPAVTRAALSGDAFSLDLLRGAALALARLAANVRQQAGNPALPIVATGGALRSELLSDLLREVLPGVTIQFRAHEEEASRLAGVLIGTEG